MNLTIGFVDLLIIVAYFYLVLCIGFYFARKGKTSTGYFLAGRSVEWWAVGASLFASNISSEHFIGLAGTGAASGLAVGHFELLAVFCCLTLGWVFVPFYLRSGVFTMPEFLERRYGAASRWYLTTVSVIAYVLTKISVTLFAGSLLLNQVLDWDIITSCLFLVIATGLYTIAGGLGAVIYTEVMQTIVLVGGATILTGMGLYQLGGWNELAARLDPGHFNMFKAIDHPDFPWTGIIFGAPILGIWYWCTDQFIVQRTLGAKNINHARSGAIFAGYLKLLPLFIMVLPGMIAAALYADINGDKAYPALVTRVLPSGLKGIVIAGLLAAIMSSLASCFNSCSTLITMDVYKKIRRRASERELVFFGRFFTLVIVLLGIYWIKFIPLLSGELYIYLQSVQAYISPPIAACFLFGVFFARLNGKGAFCSLILGFILGALRLILELLYKMEVKAGVENIQLPESLVQFMSQFSLANLGAKLNLTANLPTYSLGDLTHTLLVQPAASLGMSDQLNEGFIWLATINFLHFAILLFGVCTVVLFLISFITRRPLPEKIRGLTFRTAKEHPMGETPMAGEELPPVQTWSWLQIFFSILAAALVGAIWYIFR
ncbi:MAG: sodium/solute symporter [Candidatus Omnitrophica bacterium]|nr:sodium/solute symporter [Candidatus Omnitrophota bacterium]